MVKNPPVKARDAGLISGLGRSPGERNDNPHQYSCPENSMDKGAWHATAHRVSKSQIQQSTHVPLSTDKNLNVCATRSGSNSGSATYKN